MVLGKKNKFSTEYFLLSTSFIFFAHKYFLLSTNLTNLHESLLCAYNGDLIGRTNHTNFAKASAIEIAKRSRKYLNS